MASDLPLPLEMPTEIQFCTVSLRLIQINEVGVAVRKRAFLPFEKSYSVSGGCGNEQSNT